MKRLLVFVSVIVLGVLLFVPVCVCAEPLIDPDTVSIPAEAEALLEEQGIDWTDPESLLSLSPAEMVSALLAEIRQAVSAPLRLFGKLLAVIVFASLVLGLGDAAAERSLSHLPELLCVPVSLLLFLPEIRSLLQTLSDALEQGAAFLLSYVPVFASATAASGNISAASAYQVLVLYLAELAMQLAAGSFLPLLKASLALSAADAMYAPLSLGGLIQGFRKCVTWGLGFLMTLMTGVLGIQNLIGGSVDSVSAKTAKFVLSSAIPIVGSAVSEAYGTVRGSLGLVRSAVGVLGIAAIAVVFLPPILLLLCYRISFAGAAVVAELFGVSALKRLYQNLDAVLAAAAAVLICFAVMFLIATAMVLMTCQIS